VNNSLRGFLYSLLLKIKFFNYIYIPSIKSSVMDKAIRSAKRFFIDDIHIPAELATPVATFHRAF